jgi:type I restriction enzyme S subunit
MEKYNSYKNTGIEWLGEIPEHWVVNNLKYLLKGSLKYGANEPAIEENRKNPRYLRITDFDGNENLRENTFKSLPLNIAKAYLLKEGDLLFARSGATVGKTFLFRNYKGKACYAGYLIKATPKKGLLESKYLSLFTKSFCYTNWKESIFIQATIQNISAEKYNSLPIPLPPLKEQAQIVNYLDAKTTAIDKKVSLLQQKIKHYKAYRKTLINETVTKGLKNDNSNWVSYRLKDIGYLYSGLSGKSGNDFNQDDNPNNKGFIPFTNIANNTYLDQNHLGTVVIEEKEKQNQVKKNDIFFLMSSEGYEDIGKSAVLKDDIKETYLNSFCKGFRITKNNCEASFINYLLFSDSYRQKLLVEGKGFTRINLKMEKVNNFSVLIPPTKKEQQQIANYLDAKTATIDKIIKNIETQITTLKELRKTLINEVVTGKVKVSA